MIRRAEWPRASLQRPNLVPPAHRLVHVPVLQAQLDRRPQRLPLPGKAGQAAQAICVVRQEAGRLQGVSAEQTSYEADAEAPAPSLKEYDGFVDEVEADQLAAAATDPDDIVWPSAADSVPAWEVGICNAQI